MLKETVKYVDYNGNEREEDFYFNLNKAELIEMELGVSGGLTQMIERITKTQDTAEISKVFKEILLKAYGEKSPDGRRFIKSKELSEAFSQTEAYSELFMRLGTDSEYATNFIQKILPAVDKGTTIPAPIN